MNSADRIKQLEEEIANERRNISSCNHTYGTPYFNAEKYRKGYGSVQTGHGSDPWWDYAGYEDAYKDRWTRKCTKCGHEQHTYEQEPVIKEYRPKF